MSPMNTATLVFQLSKMWDKLHLSLFNYIYFKFQRNLTFNVCIHYENKTYVFKGKVNVKINFCKVTRDHRVRSKK